MYFFFVLFLEYKLLEVGGLCIVISLLYPQHLQQFIAYSRLTSILLNNTLNPYNFSLFKGTHYFLSFIFISLIDEQFSINVYWINGWHLLMEDNDILNKTPASTAYSWKYTLKWRKKPRLNSHSNILSSWSPRHLCLHKNKTILQIILYS